MWHLIIDLEVGKLSFLRGCFKPHWGSLLVIRFTMLQMPMWKHHGYPLDRHQELMGRKGEGCRQAIPQKINHAHVHTHGLARDPMLVSGSLPYCKMTAAWRRSGLE